MIGLTAMPKSWKSGFTSQGIRIDDVSRGFNKGIILLYYLLCYYIIVLLYHYIIILLCCYNDTWLYHYIITLSHGTTIVL